MTTLGELLALDKFLEKVNVIVQGCGQTLGLGLGQSKDIVVVFY